MSSDGTTAVQVSPIPTESEMASIRQIFTNVANALVRASELAKQVTELELRFASLNEDHTRVMARSDQLEQSLSETRTQRDEALSNLNELKSSFNNAEHEIQQLNNQARGNAEEIADLKAELAKVKADNLDLSNAWVGESRRADEAVAMLAKIKSTLGIFDPPKPESIPPQAEPTPEARPLNEAEATSAQPEPELPSEPYTPPPYTWGDPNKP